MYLNNAPRAKPQPSGLQLRFFVEHWKMTKPPTSCSTEIFNCHLFYTKEYSVYLVGPPTSSERLSGLHCCTKHWLQEATEARHVMAVPAGKTSNGCEYPPRTPYHTRKTDSAPKPEKIQIWYERVALRRGALLTEANMGGRKLQHE